MTFTIRRLDRTKPRPLEPHCVFDLDGTPTLLVWTSRVVCEFGGEDCGDVLDALAELLLET